MKQILPEHLGPASVIRGGATPRARGDHLCQAHTGPRFHAVQEVYAEIVAVHPIEKLLAKAPAVTLAEFTEPP